MRYPKHLILDFENKKVKNTNYYWIINFINNFEKSPLFFLENRKIIGFSSSEQKLKNKINKILKIKESGSNNFWKNINKGKEEEQFSKSIRYFLKFKTTKKNSNTWYQNININFLIKERLYTKLKYSRSPAYDIVSGGSAALLAGFLGFLVSEKYGIELVDSGDFYYLIMYLGILCFAVRPLVVTADTFKGFINLFSIFEVVIFYKNILILIFYKFKK